MGAAAVAAARACAYLNAGTIEFLVEDSGSNARFYFLEMNTRLQVEHPVTEAVTGVDLVRAQLAVAAGEPLPWAQDALTTRGHAIECRIYAEDPDNAFLPQAGRLLLYREPAGPGIRVDSGVAEGSDVAVNYDPLLAKLIVSAETRVAAIARLRSALRDYAILGIRTNIPFLLRLIDLPAFVHGDLHTGFIDEHLAPPVEDSPPPAAFAAAASAAAPALLADASAPPADPWAELSDWGR
jgi:3-methylcrotonyl-CoA carboxylase alpha subunit